MPLLSPLFLTLDVVVVRIDGLEDLLAFVRLLLLPIIRLHLLDGGFETLATGLGIEATTNVVPHEVVVFLSLRLVWHVLD